MERMREWWRRLRRWRSLGVLPLALACGEGPAPAPATGPLEDAPEVPPPVVHAPPVPLAADVIDGRFGAPAEATDLSVDAGGGVWVASPAGLDVRPPGRAFFSHVATTRRVTAVSGLGPGLALVGHDDGPLTLVRVEADGTARQDVVDLHGPVHAIRAAEDGARAVVAGAMGLAVVEASGRVTARRAAAPSDPELWALSLAPDGAAWFASFSELARLPGAASGDLSAALDPRVDLVATRPDHTFALAACGPDVWAATLGAGVYRLDERGGVRAHLTRADVLPQDHVISVACEPGGGVWLGTSWGGLVRLHASGTVDYHTRDAGLPGDSIRALVSAEEAGGRALWIATEGGVAVYRGP